VCVYVCVCTYIYCMFKHTYIGNVPMVVLCVCARVYVCVCTYICYMFIYTYIGNVPMVVLCDGHGYVNLVGNQPTETPQEMRNSLHVGGRQAAATLLNSLSLSISLSIQ
jgi:hypothetical protein